MFNPRKFLTKTQNPKNTLQRLLTNDEKLEFVKTSVSWISGKDIMDTCFILNFGYEAPLPWPQVQQALRKFSEAAQVKFLNERFKKYSMLPNELLTFETTNFKNLKYY